MGAKPQTRPLYDGRRARRYLSSHGTEKEWRMDRLLVLVRHGQSEWNLKNLFTGWKDVALTEVGIAEPRAAGRRLKAQGIAFDIGFTSALKRAQDTMSLMLEEMGLSGIPVIKDAALNERDYGDLSGLNKDEARRRWSDAQVHIW